MRTLRLVEFEGDGVHAVPLAGRIGAVVEDVPEVALTPGADDLGPDHAVAA